MVSWPWTSAESVDSRSVQRSWTRWRRLDGVRHDVAGAGLDAPFEDGLEAPVVALALVEREVVDEEDEPLRPIAELLDDPGEVAEVVSGDLDEAQAAPGVLVEERLDGGGLAGAAVAVEQHAVGGEAGQELLGVLEDEGALAVVADELVQADRVWGSYADEVAVPAPSRTQRNARYRPNRPAPMRA